MAILQSTTTQMGLVGVSPRVVYIATNDTEATVTTTGYLNQEQANNSGYQDADMALVTTKTSPGASDISVGWFQINHVGANWSLTPTTSPGDVVLPTIANHIATYAGTTGQLTEDPTTAISGGNIQAGLSGTAGYLASFPSAPLKGSLRVTATANTNNTLTNITNAAMGQASTITIPDPGTATASFVLSDGGTQNFSTGNIAVLTGYIQTGSTGTAGAIRIYPSGGALYSNIVSAIPSATQTITIPSTGTTAASFVLTAAAALQTITSALAVTGGSITSGVSGTAGTFISFPATGSNGTLILAATNAGGAFNTTISNGTMGQSTVYTIPDVTNALGRFLVGASATPFTSGNVLSASGTGGVVADSGIVATNVQLISQIKAQQVASLGGGGAGPLTVTAAGCTTASVICVDIVTSTNTVSVAKVTPGTGNFALLLSGDPGAVLTISYIMFIAAQ